MKIRFQLATAIIVASIVYNAIIKDFEGFIISLAVLPMGIYGLLFYEDSDDN